jgi:hypothetical protein
MKKFLAYAANVALVLVSVFLAFKVLDITVARAPHVPGFNPSMRTRDLATLDLYPYEMWHVQSNFAHTGPMPSEGYHTEDIRLSSGDKGFFIDFKLDSPPRKEPNEIRIILTGGSGAQGFGATANGKIVYSILERLLNEHYAKDKLRFRVINMAMGASVSYQNFLSLNRWAHPLDPDIILSYSGRNEFVAPMAHESLINTPYDFTPLFALTLAVRTCDPPPGYGLFTRMFPNLMSSNVGLALRMLTSRSYYFKKAQETLRANLMDGRTYTGSEFLNKLVVPDYIDALESMKRDFQGIPIVLVSQALNDKEIKSFSETFALGDDFYDKMFQDIWAKTRHYMNDDWLFIDAHRHFMEHPMEGIRTHLSDEAQQAVAEVVFKQLSARLDAGWIKAIMAKRAANKGA